jgi:diadenosine tetraphosphatase ApaH/serine/threonine PP2A family protein phosphatase
VIGAVGQPRDGDPAACYALLHHERSMLTYVRVPYDVETAAKKIVEAGCRRTSPSACGKGAEGWRPSDRGR